jgi:hypothetical protein
VGDVVGQTNGIEQGGERNVERGNPFTLCGVVDCLLHIEPDPRIRAIVAVPPLRNRATTREKKQQRNQKGKKGSSHVRGELSML